MLAYAPPTIQRMSYDDAVLYCQFCNHDGYTDWRMPTRTEYYELHLQYGTKVYKTLSGCWYISHVPVEYVPGYAPALPVRDI